MEGVIGRTRLWINLQIVADTLSRIETNALSSTQGSAEDNEALSSESRQTTHIEAAFWDAITSHIVPDAVVTDNENPFLSPNMH